LHLLSGGGVNRAAFPEAPISEGQLGSHTASPIALRSVPIPCAQHYTRFEFSMVRGAISKAHAASMSPWACPAAFS